MMTALLDGYGGLAKLRDGVLRRLKTLPHGHEDEEVALRISRACNHLSLVMADIPMAMFEVGVPALPLEEAPAIHLPLEGGAPATPFRIKAQLESYATTTPRRWFSRKEVPA